TLSTRREAKTGGRNVIKRIMPRQNEMVNEIWICDKGRFVHHYADHPDRLTQPLVRENGELRLATWDEALDKVADGLQAHKEAVAGLSGDRLSNEDLFLFQKLFRDGLESPHLALANPKLGGADVVARVGLTSGSNLQEMGAGDAIVVVASDLHQEAPVWWFRIKQATERGAALVVLNARPTRLDKFAAHTIYYEPGQALETAHQLLNAAKVALNGDEDDPLQAASSALFKAENLVAFYGSEGLAYQETEGLARTLANLLLLKDDEGRNHVGRPNNGLVPVWAHNNTQGAWDMGVRPDAGPGYQPLPETGLDAGAIYDGAASGDVRALYVMGVDPVGDGLMRGRGELDFVVVQELFLTETARLADVVLPAQSWAERDGTFTSGERRVQRFYPAIPAVGDSRPDWQIVAQVAERLGLGKPPYAAGLIFRDIAQTVPQYEGLTYRVLAEAVEQWPRVGGDDLYFAGTSYDNKSGVGRQWPSVAEAEEALELYDLPPVRSAAAEDDGVKVIAASALYRQGSLINRSEVLASRIVPPTLVLHHEDAAQLDVSQDDVANVTLDSAEYRLRVRVDNSVTRPGLGLVQGVTLPPRRTVLQLNGVEKTQQTEEIALV
ncbi:MAG: molybdopterin oxidoreductase family protein, partial [Chloroflexota bacterium]